MEVWCKFSEIWCVLWENDVACLRWNDISLLGGGMHSSSSSLLNCSGGPMVVAWSLPLLMSNNVSSHKSSSCIKFWSILNNTFTWQNTTIPSHNTNDWLRVYAWVPYCWWTFPFQNCVCIFVLIPPVVSFARLLNVKMTLSTCK